MMMDIFPEAKMTQKMKAGGTFLLRDSIAVCVPVPLACGLLVS
jgi:hypothetical protein